MQRWQIIYLRNVLTGHQTKWLYLVGCCEVERECSLDKTETCSRFICLRAYICCLDLKLVRIEYTGASRKTNLVSDCCDLRSQVGGVWLL